MEPKLPWEEGAVLVPGVIPLPPHKRAVRPPNAMTEKVAHRDEEAMTPDMKARRDAFVVQFALDWNQTQAALRIGIPAASASKQASELMQEPYVQKRLSEYIEELEEDCLITRNRVLAGLLREANFQGHGASHSARVTAFARLAVLKGMEFEPNKPTGASVPVTPVTEKEVKVFTELFEHNF